MAYALRFNKGYDSGRFSIEVLKKGDDAEPLMTLILQRTYSHDGNPDMPYWDVSSVGKNGAFEGRTNLSMKKDGSPDGIAALVKETIDELNLE